MLSSIPFRLAAVNVLLTVIALGAAWAISGNGAVMLIAGAAAAGVGGAVSAGVLLRRLGRITAAADSIARGDLDVRIAPQPAGELGELAGAVNGMADRLEALTAAARDRGRLTALLNGSIDGIIAVDEDGGIAFANDAAARLLDRPQEELIGETLAWVMPNEQVRELVDTSRAGGQAGSRIVERPGGQYLEVFCAPLGEDARGELLLLVRDLTALRRAERVRRDFVANVSHELRTPVASIKSVIETLQGGALEDRKAAADFLARAETEVDRLAEMVEELLELSRIESGEVPPARQPVDVSGVVERAVERLRPQADRQRLDISMEVAPSLPVVLGDAERLERAVLNLVHNAIKFTPSAGSVGISVGREGDAVTISVSDTGVGIAPEDRARVFERFYKADRSRGSRGTGLGLAVVKHTVEALGGTVGVESAPGKGSTFRISLPLAPVPANRRR